MQPPGPHAPLYPSAPALFATSQGTACQGHRLCHWCGAPCLEKWTHDEPPMMVGVKRTYLSRHPSYPWICTGCFLFRRPRVTVPFLGGGYRDGQAPMKYSWLITETASWVVQYPDSKGSTWDKLLNPPKRFALSIIEGGNLNQLQLCPVNELVGIIADTPLWFLLNGTVLSYTVYELEDALRHGDAGKEPGVRALVRLFGRYDKLPPADEVKRGRGRPSNSEDPAKAIKKVVRASGSPA